MRTRLSGDARAKAHWRHLSAVTVVGLLLASGASATDITVAGLFPNKAVVQIDGGAPQTLSVGQRSREGVVLLSVEGDVATFDVAGKRQAVRLGTGRMAASPSAAATAVVHADTAGHFVADGDINGRSTRFLVDTGATSIALSATDARRVGLDFQAGRKGVVRTANGTVAAWQVRLDTVRVGTITLYGVDAVVMEGEKLPLPLLGMSFLNRVDMRRDGDAMTLTKRH
jgi:aspartyl protease family protein